MSGEPVAIYTFRDAEGRHHPAVAVGRTTLGKRAYTLAVSDRAGLVVLEEKGATLAPVTDAAVVSRVEAAMRAATSDAAEPALSFEAKGKDGRRARFAATRAVAHAGQAYLYAVDPATGGVHVFRAPEGRAEPALVSDAALAARVRAIVETGDRAPQSGGAVLTLPSGERRPLDIVQRAEVGPASYAIGLDRADRDRAYVLRLGPAGALSPVTDAAEVDRVRAALGAPDRMNP